MAGRTFMLRSIPSPASYSTTIMTELLPISAWKQGSRITNVVRNKRGEGGEECGDFDNDGDVDALVLNLNDLPSLLRNEGGNKNNWINIKLIGTYCNRTAIGARVRVSTGNHVQTNEVASGGSVMSQSDLRLHFGLGKAKAIDLIEVRWPTTLKTESFRHIEANQFLAIREGSGIVKVIRRAEER